MLIRYSDILCSGAEARVSKRIFCAEYPEGADASAEGAFPRSGELEITLEIPRRLGAVAAALRICRDGGESRDIPLAWRGGEGFDAFSARLSLAELCGGEEDGLFYYEFLLYRGWDLLYSDSINNVDLTLSGTSTNRFRLLIYRDSFATPGWLGGGIIYHIFADRFRRGEGVAAVREDAVIDDDWEGGIPQYALRPGDELANNVFFGGNLWGVIEKLDYIASLGTGAIYLSPVFEAYSNHRYDTGDYERIDALLGGEEAFEELIRLAGERGIKIILDGVFNHTGDDSRYFDRYGRYGGTGAYSSQNSPYFKWFTFREYPDAYECWWGIKIHPRLNQSFPPCRSYFTGEGGVGADYVARGAGGWRLDVADELCDGFLDDFRASVKSASGGEALIIGEVWENAADKLAYGKRRRYLRGAQLDSVMNYPLRNAVINFVLYSDSGMLYNILTEIHSSYPPCVRRVLMNLLGTHDTERILTALADAGTEGMSNASLAAFRLGPAAYETARRRLMLASVIQYTVFGVPSLYYGDEAGLEGGRDPFCRMPYPWGGEDGVLLSHYRRLGEIRSGERVFDGGDFKILSYACGTIIYERTRGDERLIIAANSTLEAHSFALSGRHRDLLGGESFSGCVSIPPLGAVILKKEGGER